MGRAIGRSHYARHGGAEAPPCTNLLKEDSGPNVLRREGPFPDCRPSGVWRELASPVQLPTSGQPPPGSRKNCRSAGPPPFSGTAYETTSRRHVEDGFHRLRSSPQSRSGGARVVGVGRSSGAAGG